jgi:predicted transcriptional regulator
VRAINLLRELAKRRAIGPSPAFNELHLLKALEITRESGPIGRIKLSRCLKLGEGATRTLIEHLRASNLIEIVGGGCKLTRMGLSILNELNSKITGGAKVAKSPITVGAHNFGVLVRNAAHKVRYGIEQRDAAVRVGSTGATTIVFKNNKLSAPSLSEDLSKDWPKVADEILEIFKPKENDVILICGADTEEEAEKGAKAAAWTLIEDC